MAHPQNGNAIDLSAVAKHRAQLAAEVNKFIAETSQAIYAAALAREVSFGTEKMRRIARESRERALYLAETFGLITVENRNAAG